MDVERPIVVVHLTEDGAVADVDVAGHDEPTDIEGTKREDPIAEFGDDEFRQPYSAKAKPWLA